MDLSVPAGGSVGVIGESGSGKTSLALASLMLLPRETVVRGSIQVCGRELVGASSAVHRSVRWSKIASVIQAPGRGFNPVRRVISQVVEPLRLHRGLKRPEAHRRAESIASDLGLAPELLQRHPHQLSGGQQIRAMLTMALTCDPEVLVLDEVTSGLDAATRRELLTTLAHLREATGVALLVISHDIASISALTDESSVLYAGKVMERGPSRRVLSDPRHPYTRDLLRAYPTMTTQKDLRGIRGDAPDPADPPSGCSYHPRCTQVIDRCTTWDTEFDPVAGRDVLCLRGGLVERLRANGLSKSFRPGRGQVVEALREVDLTIREGEIVGLVGETGSGKSTLARLLVGLGEPDSGEVVWEGTKRHEFTSAQQRAFQRDAAIVFQDPFAATSPRMTVHDVVREPLDAQRTGSAADRAQRARSSLTEVGLPSTDAFLRRRAHTLSGGQLQRVAVARALVLDPRLLIADEPTSMLDASEQANLLTLLVDLQTARGMALLFISHELAVLRKVADRILVLDRGRIVEAGPGHRILTSPQHAATRTLVGSAPRLVVDEDEHEISQREVRHEAAPVPAVTTRGEPHET